MGTRRSAEQRRAGAVGPALVRAASRLASALAHGESDPVALGDHLEGLASALGAPVVHLTRLVDGQATVWAGHGLAVGPGHRARFDAAGVPGSVLSDPTAVVVVDDASTHPGWFDLTAGTTRSGVYAPVGAGEHTACLAVESTGTGAFDADAAAVVGAVAEIVGIARQARGAVDVAERTAEQERTRRVASEAGAAVVAAGLVATDTDGACAAMLEAGAVALGWDSAAVLQRIGHGWHVAAVTGGSELAAGARFPAPSVVDHVVVSGATDVGPVHDGGVLIPDAASRLVAPVLTSGAVEWLLVVEGPDRRDLDETSRGHAVAVAARMGLVLERLELRMRDQQVRDRLDEAHRVRANLLAVAGHELRTPLTIVRGYAETLRAAVDRMSAAQQAQALDALLDRATHLSVLVDRVMLASRLQAGDVRIVPRVCLLEVALAEEAWGDGVETSIPPGTTVRADAVWLRRALEVLVEFARDAGDGRVHVEADVTGDATTIALRFGGAAASTGQRVFDPFGGDGTTGSSDGLGPHLARELIRLMGGEVRVYSPAGYDSTFVVVLPSA